MGHALALVRAMIVKAWAFLLVVPIENLPILYTINFEASVPAGSLLTPMHRCLELSAYLMQYNLWSSAHSRRSVLWSPGKACAFFQDLPSAARLLEFRQGRLLLSRSVFKQGPNLTWKRLAPNCVYRNIGSHSCYNRIRCVCCHMMHPGAGCRLCAHPDGQAHVHPSAQTSCQLHAVVQCNPTYPSPEAQCTSQSRAVIRSCH